MCGAQRKHFTSQTLTGEQLSGLTHSTCAICATTILTFVVSHDVGSVAVGLVSDLTLQEATAFLVAPSVDYDDVLALYAATTDEDVYVKDFIV